MRVACTGRATVPSERPSRARGPHDDAIHRSHVFLRVTCSSVTARNTIFNMLRNIDQCVLQKKVRMMLQQAEAHVPALPLAGRGRGMRIATRTRVHMHRANDTSAHVLHKAAALLLQISLLVATLVAREQRAADDGQRVLRRERHACRQSQPPPAAAQQPRHRHRHRRALTSPASPNQRSCRRQSHRAAAADAAIVIMTIPTGYDLLNGICTSGVELLLTRRTVILFTLAHAHRLAWPGWPAHAHRSALCKGLGQLEVPGAEKARCDGAIQTARG